MPTVFTKILNGELPSYKIHEDELTFSFLALDQVNPGHVLVIPKQEVNHWFDVPPEIYTRVGLNAQKIAKAIKLATGCPRIGVMVAGFEVPHYHMHLIPASSIPELDFKRAQKLSPEAMQEIQKKIIEALNYK
ncbi:HIT family protein [Bdellovibrio sp. qaytius]|nr:HIT family protein [Bdellovibrio sp. qaytius]